MPVRVRVSGTESLIRKLNNLNGELRGRTVERALTAAALPIANAAKANAPYRTGNLRRSIHIGGHEELTPDFQNTTGTGIEEPEVSPSRVVMYVGTNVVYARQREYGGTIRARNAPFLVWQDEDGTWRRARAVTQEATPYLRPAVDEHSGEARDEFGQALRELVRAAVR